MSMFHPANPGKSDAHQRVHAACELAITIVEFLAALFFIIGSIMFFYESLVYTGTWLFLIGSIFFATRPSIKVVRELKYLALGKIDVLAKGGE